MLIKPSSVLQDFTALAVLVVDQEILNGAS
jgi:hypothetical protein